MRRFPARRKTEEVMVETLVWACTGEGCPGWMRVEFTLQEQPVCPHCSSAMIKTNRMAPSMEEEQE